MPAPYTMEYLSTAASAGRHNNKAVESVTFTARRCVGGSGTERHIKVIMVTKRIMTAHHDLSPITTSHLDLPLHNYNSNISAISVQLEVQCSKHHGHGEESKMPVNQLTIKINLYCNTEVFTLYS